MEIKYPTPEILPRLRRLWKTAFGDTEDFMDGFYGSGFSPDRCRCILEGEQVAAMLYWFDCQWDSCRYAYIYGVATDPAFRNRGLCRQLMGDTHALLKKLGYAGAVLVPQQEGLRKMYAALGYEDMGRVSYVNGVAGEGEAPLRKIGPEDYARLRKTRLPQGGLVQEGENLTFLDRIYELYEGQDFLLAAFREEGFLWGLELLGPREAAPGILKTLGCGKGRFRTPGDTHPFAMWLPLAGNAKKPAYFGLAFD